MDQSSSEIAINAQDIEKYAGKPIFTEDTIYESKNEPLPPGIVMGLAWNPLGGSPIFIETEEPELSSRLLSLRGLRSGH